MPSSVPTAVPWSGGASISRRDGPGNSTARWPNCTLEIRLLLGHGAETAEGLARSYLTALRLRDEAAANHAVRVSELSRSLGAAMGLDEGLDLLERAAMLHDIGKFALPDALLKRADPLSEQELQVVRRFPEFGHDVLRGIPCLADCAPIVLAQLEHYDGSGTPLGLRGDRIPPASRIVAVVNAYDVMTHPRLHARQQPALEALQELEACAGTQFDPQAVLRMLDHLGVAPTLDDWGSEVWSG